MQRLTKLDQLLTDKTAWDDDTWFQAKRYMLDNTSQPSMQFLLDLAGCRPTSGAEAIFKTDAVKLLRAIPPRTVLKAWALMRARWGVS
jgi:hypothetical protein